ncbi:glutamate racemase [Marinobacter lutaoensis]|uniref:Glutamate racemase n=1 Tax=Marinobacter lutaoensis TaxID=135739 RepID=A0A1V2DQD3_9GAMM|nr:glutamate racemase [Marinobacter lutaoensis]MBE01637.1 glutamate racemase [Marinobacter sp.]MBI42985.1 glutamate racemase [Oceanospirillales bacterium]NVD34601.1 glutamate racemase [Marinobacter lutaoensis]ONF42862.1 glutamate racemase [Marinobacter lutaoensis]
MTRDARPRILVFDSGIGGLSVTRCIRAVLPGVHFVYLADSAGFPYGDQSDGVVVERCVALVEQALVEFRCDLVVVACNTASTVVLPHLRARVSVPVVGVVPAIKPAAGLTRNGRLGVLATPATIRRPYLNRLIDEFANHCLVERVGHPALVAWAEGLVRGDPVPVSELAGVLRPLREAGVDTVVLGCTHYPLLLASLRQALPEVVHWVDSGEAIARRVSYLLAQGAWPMAPLRDQRAYPPVEAVLLSGEARERLPEFMVELDLATGRVESRWGGLAPVRAAGSV